MYLYPFTQLWMFTWIWKPKDAAVVGRRMLIFERGSKNAWLWNIEYWKSQRNTQVIDTPGRKIYELESHVLILTKNPRKWCKNSCISFYCPYFVCVPSSYPPPNNINNKNVHKDRIYLSMAILEIVMMETVVDRLTPIPHITNQGWK